MAQEPSGDRASFVPESRVECWLSAAGLGCVKLDLDVEGLEYVYYSLTDFREELVNNTCDEKLYATAASSLSHPNIPQVTRGSALTDNVTGVTVQAREQQTRRSR